MVATLFFRRSQHWAAARALDLFHRQILWLWLAVRVAAAAW
jgi:hypothetical protein